MSETKTDEKIRILLADDHQVLRSGLRALLNLEPDFEVVGDASNGLLAIVTDAA